MLTLKEEVTAGDFRRCLQKLGRPTSAATLFGIELGLDAEDVVTFTWSNVRAVKWLLSPYAKQILNSQPRHLTCPYVFWRQVENMTLPLFGFEQDVFDAFGLTWGELQKVHNRMIWIDEEVEQKHWNSVLRVSAS